MSTKQNKAMMFNNYAYCYIQKNFFSKESLVFILKLLDYKKKRF